MTTSAAPIPSWTPRHDMTVSVMSEGRALGFTVGDMLPERRFAVAIDGELIGRLEFSEQYRRFWLAQTANEEPSLVAIPNIVEFVSVTRDQDGRMVPIGWDRDNDRPREPAVKGHGGILTPEQIAARAEVDTERVETEIIKRLVRDGVLTAEQGMQQIMGIGASPAPVATDGGERPPAASGAPGAGDTDAERGAGATLTARERQIIDLAGDGPATKEVIARVANKLGLSESTVRVYLGNARAKMRASSENEPAEESA